MAFWRNVADSAVPGDGVGDSVARRQRIIEATLQELDREGSTQLRLKRVASIADTSIGLIASYFGGREGVIAEANLVRYQRTFDAYLAPIPSDLTIDLDETELRGMITRMIDESMIPTRRELRLELVESIAVAQHNPTAAEAMAAVQLAADKRIMRVAEQFADRGLLADGVTPLAFARFWYSLLFGQVVIEGSSVFMINNDEWEATLLRISKTLIRPVAATPG